MSGKPSIFKKVFISHLAIGILSVVGFSAIFYILFERAIIDRTIDQLSSINVLKEMQIDQYFRDMESDLEFQLTPENTSHWFVPGKPPESTAFANELAYLRKRYDVISILILYDNQKPSHELGTDSILWATATALAQHPPIETFDVIDVSASVPSGQTELVYVLPLRQLDGRLLGHILLREKFEKVQKILQETTGMGSTGESYLVGKDFKMRSASRFLPQIPPLRIVVQTESTRNAFNGTFGGEKTTDYRDVEVLSFSRKLTAPAPDWIIVSEIDYTEAMKPVNHWRNIIIGAALIIIMIIFAVSYFIANSISEPILYLKEVIATLSRGTIPRVEVKPMEQNEVGQIANAVRELITGWKRTTQFADDIGSGKFDASFTKLSEQDTLGTALLRMRDRLRELTDQQIRLIREKTSAMLEGQEQERKRIVRELHDGVGQLLSVIRLQVQMLEKKEKSSREIQDLVNEVIDEVRRISHNLMPHSIVDFGLKAALEGLCDEIRKVSIFTVDFTYVQEFDHNLRFEISIALYRIVQEAFNNVLKHADASHVELQLIDAQHQIYLLLKDNGKGFDRDSSHSSGFGLRTMEERTKLLNGKFDIYSTPGKGTELEVTIPLA